jgi:circadian clock protein KaiC
VKKRSGGHEHAIREYSLSQAGITIGPPMSGFTGILTGVPRFIGPRGAPVQDADDPK